MQLKQYREIYREIIILNGCKRKKQKLGNCLLKKTGKKRKVKLEQVKRNNNKKRN